MGLRTDRFASGASNTPLRGLILADIPAAAGSIIRLRACVLVVVLAVMCLAACASEKLEQAPPAGVDFSGSWKLNVADSDDPQRLIQAQFNAPAAGQSSTSALGRRAAGVAARAGPGRSGRRLSRGSGSRHAVGGVAQRRPPVAR